MTTPLDTWEPCRAPECDTAAREASIDGLLTFILMRHGAWSSADDSNPHKAIYLEARDNAICELKWRILENWHEADLHCRKWQRLGETLDAIRDVMTERAGYEKRIKTPQWPFARPNQTIIS